mmetsp:Transcript_19348/g.23107  ORF Transcript_19348/g.23107 Transcript_19348/m.23107 type:complete len:374 (+) Transcript_19348:112-1233(+)|eukprot:CAMPEP_0197852258 /NCGR_PEP_ID=MMETSP1438-20131217/20059_1 /TAXON_ID=1461541 /ORGANISM="Pterosperma sp., Strain CCMP1384" /LENGTH=373 /DNA_ID=CAMNT_0043466203 /DNA_START=112 /DNA_END=1233 /DNA_ORIENTATION=+
MADIGEHQFSRTKRCEGTDRLDRVLDAKTRTIGVDKGALAAQVAEKSMRLSSEKSRELAYDQLNHFFDNKMVMLEQERRDIKRQINKDHVDYWIEEQSKPQTREWDLNDPAMLKKDLPARTGDLDERLGVSAAQVFTGEDLQAGYRKKLQQDQQKSWCDQQVAEKLAREKAEADDIANHTALMGAQNDYANNVANAESYSRRELAKLIVSENLNTADMKAHKSNSDKMNEEQSNATEQLNTYNSAFMTEHPHTAQSSLSNYRKRMDHYKGMSDLEKQDVLTFQAMQRGELAAKREAERAEETAYAQYQENVRRQLCQTHSKVEDFKMQQRLAVKDTLMAQKAEKDARDTHLNKTLYTNDPTPDYFGQFGTSHR